RSDAGLYTSRQMSSASDERRATFVPKEAQSRITRIYPLARGRAPGIVVRRPGTKSHAPIEPSRRRLTVHRSASAVRAAVTTRGAPPSARKLVAVWDHPPHGGDGAPPSIA